MLHDPYYNTGVFRFDNGDLVRVKILDGPKDKRSRACQGLSWTMGEILTVVPVGASPRAYLDRFGVRRTHHTLPRGPQKATSYLIRLLDESNRHVIAEWYKIRPPMLPRIITGGLLNLKYKVWVREVKDGNAK